MISNTFFVIIIIILLYIYYLKINKYKQLEAIYIIDLSKSIINIKFIRNKERFNSVEVNYYVIHDRLNNKRKEVIDNNQKLLGKDIKIFDAFMIKEYDKDDIKNKYSLKDVANLRPGEIGCYLSHLNLLRSINKSDGYTVIFEDDLKILDNKLHENVLKIINTIDEDFDIIFLGNLNDNHGSLVKDNIYNIDSSNSLWGTHAYIVKNNNIDKIISKIENVYHAIDNVYKRESDKGEIKSFVIYPVLVNQTSEEIGSTIIR